MSQQEALRAEFVRWYSGIPALAMSDANGLLALELEKQKQRLDTTARLSEAYQSEKVLKNSERVLRARAEKWWYRLFFMADHESRLQQLASSVVQTKDQIRELAIRQRLLLDAEERAKESVDGKSKARDYWKSRAATVERIALAEWQALWEIPLMKTHIQSVYFRAGCLALRTRLWTMIARSDPNVSREIGELEILFPLGVEKLPIVFNLTRTVTFDKYTFDAPHMCRGNNCWGKERYDLSLLKGEVRNTVFTVLRTLQTADTDQWGTPVWKLFPLAK